MTDMPSAATITRQQLVEVAERALDLALSAEQPDITPEIKAQVSATVRQAAARVPRISGGPVWWDPEAQCGCLVGTVLRRSPRVSEGLLGSAYIQVGLAYLDALESVVGAKRGASRYWSVLEVVD